MEQLIALILSCVVLFVPQARETDEAEPFYQYFDPSGELQMVLYFDVETQQGYGTRFQDGESGEFSFQETAPADGEWEDLWLEDYCVIPEEYSEGVDHYQESYERDGEGRLLHFEATGDLTEYSQPENDMICGADFFYDQDGALTRREFWRNPMLWGTTRSSQTSYFDSLGRVCYERAYITHGSLDYYFIYPDGGMEPLYCLCLDDNLGTWFPCMFVFGPSDENAGK